ncbi:MAG: thiol-activated cytolysin family protein [Lewinellaceae bacterium]|nr:thiol-activated cytolysin family protein [Phaeodactylibacter sp.]MCB9352110.1 thiol-activated cytolysin family protein [Lewinellaceae bacterium]
MQTFFSFCKVAMACCLFLLGMVACEMPPPVTPEIEFTPPADPCEDPESIIGAIECAKCDTFNSLIRSMQYFSNPEPSPRTESNEREEVVDLGDRDWVCTYRDVKWAPEYNELFILNPATEVIFPGSMLDGASIADGSYRPIITDRDTMTLSASIPKLPGVSQRILVANPSLSSVRDGSAELLQDIVPDGTPASIGSKLEKVYSEQEAYLSLNANFKGWGASVTASYDFERAETRSRFLFQFWQVYYSIDVDPPSYPCEWFNPIPNPERTIELFGGTMPVYVSSVKYGRMVYFMVESEHSEEEVERALNVSYSGFGVGGGVSITDRDKQVLNESTINALIIGGPSGSAINAVAGFEELKGYLQEGANFSATSPGAPIAYTLRFIDDNSVANVVLSSEYTIRQCAPQGEKVTLPPAPPARVYDGCPILIHGDGEFGSPAVKITGTVSLRINQEGNAVLASIYFLFDEPLEETHPGDTRAVLEDEIIAYELNDINKYIANILTEEESTIDFTPANVPGNGNHHPPFTGEFLDDIIVQAAGGGDDLPCVGYTENPDGRAFVRILFKGLKVNVVSR